MPKFIQETEGANGWCRWVPVLMRGYKMACCDCGLVHNVNFKAVRVLKTNKDGSWEYRDLPIGKFRVMLKARRNLRSTGQLRRYKKRPHGRRTK